MKQIEVVYPGPSDRLELVIPVTGENYTFEKGVPQSVDEEHAKRFIRDHGVVLATSRSLKKEGN